MADHFTDKACFKCHNNNNKTDPLTASRDCATCHRKVAANPETSTDAMGLVIATAFTGDDAAKAVLLSGKQGATAQSTACLSCHGAATPPKPVTERGKTLDLHVDVAGYAHGTHANLPCATCHTGTKGAESFLDRPHAVARPDNATCLSCHNVGLDHQVKAFGKSAHAEKLKDKVSCGSCHNPHAQPKKPQQVAYASLAATYNAQCLACHGNAARLKELSGKDVPEAKTGHAFLTNWDAHAKAVMCVECHTPVADPNDHLIGEKKTAVRDCTTCHAATNKSLIVARADRHVGGAAPVTSGYFPPRQAAPVLSAVAGTAVSGIFAAVLLHGFGRLLPRRRQGGRLTSEYLYPAFVRVSHWINAALMCILGYTGLSVRFMEAPWALGLEAATRIHNVCGVLLALNFLAYLLRAVVTGDIRQYLPEDQGGLRPILVQARYYCYGIFRGEAHPFPFTPGRRFNPLQRATYLLVFLLGMPVLIASGALLLLPQSATAAIAPRQFLVAAHFAIVSGFALFVVGHLYLATTGATPLSLIKGMVTGRHEEQEPDAPPAGKEPNDR
jgi:thiosulfate reductase cytochrome b subunit